LRKKKGKKKGNNTGDGRGQNLITKLGLIEATGIQKVVEKKQGFKQRETTTTSKSGEKLNWKTHNGGGDLQL